MAIRTAIFPGQNVVHRVKGEGGVIERKITSGEGIHFPGTDNSGGHARSDVGFHTTRGKRHFTTGKQTTQTWTPCRGPLPRTLELLPVLKDLTDASIYIVERRGGITVYIASSAQISEGYGNVLDGRRHHGLR